MEAETFGRIVRGNWHSISLFLVIVSSGFWLALTPDDASNVDAAPALSQDQRESDSEAAARRMQDTLAAIKYYENEVTYNRGNVETPENLYRLATLYFSGVSDYDKAVLYYEALIQEYPGHAKVNEAYPNLVVCYERLANEDLRRATLRRMLDHFPAEDKNHVFAKQELGL